ncbi:DUF397 domain-containing protein [Actinomadura sp. KC216]|uniref:DUF397 domain-containing protein n=1 Tax=Actinomadura sp. KC216 TaxID=2530370 RepID=UPI001052C8EE|nr:DUF397 domain-containing protein [Actinomadura sp. KC216]TDB84051.1 DUF397 domain-containing protein [Actinomadura sp. KC216]
MDVTKWRKARQSSDQGDACVEVARFPEAVAVRDSKGPKLMLTPHTFHTILNNLKQ